MDVIAVVQREQPAMYNTNVQIPPGIQLVQINLIHASEGTPHGSMIVDLGSTPYHDDRDIDLR